MEGLVKSIYKPFHHIFLLDHDELNNRKLFYQQDYPLKNYYFVMSILIHSQHFDQLKNWMKITLIQLRKIPYNELKRLEFLDQSGSEWFFIFNVKTLTVDFMKFTSCITRDIACQLIPQHLTFPFPALFIFAAFHF